MLLSVLYIYGLIEQFGFKFLCHIYVRVGGNKIWCLLTLVLLYNHGEVKKCLQFDM